MKQLSVLVLLSLLAISCKKEEEVKEVSSGNFTITGIRDVDLSVTSDGRFSFPISVVPTSGAKDTVRLAAEEVPRGVYCSFLPTSAGIPFSSTVTVSTDFSAAGGTYHFLIKGIGSSGTRIYDINVTLAAYRGWQLDGVLYEKQSLSKYPGNGADYPYIIVHAPNNAQLRMSFPAQSKLPSVTSTYKISADSGKNNVQIAIYDGPNIWSATGNRTDGTDPAMGTFTVDTLGKFTFKCANVEMSNGLIKKPLNCSFSE